MSSARGNDKAASCNEYEQLKLQNIERNKKRMAALNIPELVNSMAQQRRVKRCCKKKDKTSIPTAEPPNLRPRPKKKIAQDEDEQVLAGLQPIGDFLSDNVGEIQTDDQSNGATKRAGRGITKLENVFSRKPDMPKIKVSLNARGQPVGQTAKQFARAIGCLVRKQIPIGHADWRLVSPADKLKLWTDVKEYYDINGAVYNWVMRTAARKWKNFKSDIKKRYFNPEITIEEIPECPDERVNPEDWQYLCEYWMSSEFKIVLKLAKQTDNLWSWSIHVAVQLGRPPRRDETFVKTHTKKNGVPLPQAEEAINQIKDVVELYPELKERTIQEGDLFAVALGDKEPKGYVRVFGLGPTPQDVGTPRLKCYAPTRLQMEILAREKAESEKAALEQQVRRLQDQLEQRPLPDRASVEPGSQHGSNIHRHLNSGDAEDNQGVGDCTSGDEYLDVEDDQIFLNQMRGANSSRPAGNHVTTSKTNDAPCFEHDVLVGKDVILYALLRSNQPVAKGTIIGTKPSIKLGDQPLGRQYCEIIVNSVLKRDTILPRPYDGMETLADAIEMPIAWPYKKLKIANKPSKPATSGHVGTSKIAAARV